MPKPGFSERSTSLISRFRRNKRANIAVTFAIALVPMIAGIGCVMDYALATRVKAKLQAAADSASVASLSTTSPGYIAAQLMLTDGPIPAGVADSLNVFYGNIGNLTGYTNLTVTPVVTKTGTQITSSLTFSATIPSTFLKVVGYPSLSMGSSSNASITLPRYQDFYLMLDVSASMGLGSTSGEMTRLAAVNPDNYTNYPTGCVFACHFATTNDSCPNSTQKYATANYCMGYPISRTSQLGYATLLTNYKGSLPAYRTASLPSSLYGFNKQYPNDPNLTLATSCPTAGTDACIQLRADAVGNALQTLLADAIDPKYMKVPAEFRVGLYPFVQYLETYFPLTAVLNGSSTTPGTINYAAANLATQLDTNTNQSLGSGGTHFENALPSMNQIITSVGTGDSAVNTLPYVFIVTDGAADLQSKALNGGGWSGSNQATVITSSSIYSQTIGACTAMKNRGIKISVLYIPYQPISPANASFASNEDGAANTNIPFIPASLQACASPNDSSGSYFYTANTPADITAALNTMFQQSVKEAHITN